MPDVRRTRATLRSAEFGFFGVVVYTRVQTPRRWGEPFSAGVLVFSTLSSRPLRTSWLIVGMGGLDLLPALGWCSRITTAYCSAGGAFGCRPRWGPPRSWSQAILRPPRSGVSPSPGPADVRRTGIGRPSRLGVATLRPPCLMAGRWTPATGRHQPLVTQAHREREQAQAPWAQLTTVPAPWRPVKAGYLTRTAMGRPPPTEVDDTLVNDVPR